MGCVHGTNQVSVLGAQKPNKKDEDNKRDGSATSKASRHSGDSGFDDEEALVNEQMMIQRDILSKKRIIIYLV